MKAYNIHVEYTDFIDVEAETEDQAIEQAIEIARSNTYGGEWDAFVMHERDLEITDAD
jgi:hypothetical protein